jgi:hypothetical protein
MRLLGLRLPKEHGAWAMLYVPFALGSGVAGRTSWALLWTWLAMTALFFARDTLWRLRQAHRRQHPTTEVRRALAAEAAVIIAAAALLILRSRLLGFLPLGAAAVLVLLFHLERATQREERSLAAELLAVGGFALAAPAAHYAARGAWQPQAVWLWLFSGLYFASSIFRVKLRVLGVQSQRRHAFVRLRRVAAAYHAALLVLLVALAARRDLPALVLVAYAPILLHAAWSFVRAPARLDLRRAGFFEIGCALYFLAFATLGLRSWTPSPQMTAAGTGADGTADARSSQIRVFAGVRSEARVGTPLAFRRGAAA